MSQNSHSSAIVVPSQRPMVAMLSLKTLPVDVIVLPSPRASAGTDIVLNIGEEGCADDNSGGLSHFLLKKFG